MNSIKDLIWVPASGLVSYVATTGYFVSNGRTRYELVELDIYESYLAAAICSIVFLTFRVLLTAASLPRAGTITNWLVKQSEPVSKKLAGLWVLAGIIAISDIADRSFYELSISGQSFNSVIFYPASLLFPLLFCPLLEPFFSVWNIAKGASRQWVNFPRLRSHVPPYDERGQTIRDLEKQRRSALRLLVTVFLWLIANYTLLFAYDTAKDKIVVVADNYISSASITYFALEDRRVRFEAELTGFAYPTLCFFPIDPGNYQLDKMFRLIQGAEIWVDISGNPSSDSLHDNGVDCLDIRASRHSNGKITYKISGILPMVDQPHETLGCEVLLSRSWGSDNRGNPSPGLNRVHDGRRQSKYSVLRAKPCSPHAFEL